MSPYLIWLVLLSGFLLANLPFMMRLRVDKGSASPTTLASSGPRRSIFRIPLEMLACYAIWLGIAMALEQQTGALSPKAWQFFAITGLLFLVFASPGFVAHKLWKPSTRRTDPMAPSHVEQT